MMAIGRVIGRTRLQQTIPVTYSVKQCKKTT